MMRRSVRNEPAFAKTAETFCAHVENAGSQERAPFVRECFRLISRLLTEVVDLPEGKRELDTHRVSRERYSEIVSQLKQQFGMDDFYRMLFYSYEEPDDPPIFGSLSDDLADILRELKSGLEAFRSGRAEYAMGQWRFSFAYHWGPHHAANVLKPLMALLLRDGWYE